MSSSPSAVPEPVAALVSLFEESLADLSFPEVDTGTLAEAVADVQSARAELQSRLAEVQGAREALEARQGALLELARKAHAYASVYARDKAELAEQLAAIQVDPPAAPRKRKRGRPRKQAAKQQTQISVAEDAA